MSIGELRLEVKQIRLEKVLKVVYVGRINCVVGLRITETILHY